MRNSTATGNGNPDTPRFPAASGTYVLALTIDRQQRCRIGRLGDVELTPGCHYYVGSALGPGGLKGRLGRHTRPLTRCRWHVDHLRSVAAVCCAWYMVDALRWEHVWAHALSAEQGLTIAVPRFGASDCDCPSHLFRDTSLTPRADLSEVLAAASGGVGNALQEWRPPTNP